MDGTIAVQKVLESAFGTGALSRYAKTNGKGEWRSGNIILCKARRFFLIAEIAREDGGRVLNEVLKGRIKKTLDFALPGQAKRFAGVYERI